MDVASVDMDALYTGKEMVDAATLVSPFTEAEAYAAVRAMNRTSLPGPDGFGPAFYTAAWQTVLPAVMQLARAFQSDEAELERLNRAYIVMIPKSATVLEASDYRSICLQNCSLKIISKMLTTRLQHQIPRLIDPDQKGFIRGCSISENFIYAMELVQCCHRRKLPTLMLKLDFAKAFDSVNWESLAVGIVGHTSPGPHEDLYGPTQGDVLGTYQDMKATLQGNVYCMDS